MSHRKKGLTQDPYRYATGTDVPYYADPAGSEPWCQHCAEQSIKTCEYHRSSHYGTLSNRIERIGAAVALLITALLLILISADLISDRIALGTLFGTAILFGATLTVSGILNAKRWK